MGVRPIEPRKPRRPKTETMRQFKVRRRRNLFERQKGRCHWCRAEMVLPPDGRHVKHMAPNTATIEHLRDRFDPTRTERLKFNQPDRRWVLACLACNNKRGAQRQAAQGKEELRRRSGYLMRHPSRSSRRTARRRKRKTQPRRPQRR